MTLWILIINYFMMIMLQIKLLEKIIQKETKSQANGLIQKVSILFYIISSVMHVFWLALTHDLLEDRRIDDIIIKTFLNSLLYKTNRFQVTVRLFSNRSQRTSKCGKNISVPLFCSYHILTSSVIYYWTDAWQLGIYLLIDNSWTPTKFDKALLWWRAKLFWWPIYINNLVDRTKFSDLK